MSAGKVQKHREKSNKKSRLARCIDPPPTKMLVIGGSDDDFIATASVEIFDLADPGNECPPLPDMPYPRVGMEAVLTQEDQA